MKNIFFLVIIKFMISKTIMNCNRVLLRGVINRHKMLNPNNKFNFNVSNKSFSKTFSFEMDNEIFNITGPFEFFWENFYYELKNSIREKDNFDMETFKMLYEIIYIKNINVYWSIKNNV